MPKRALLGPRRALWAAHSASQWRVAPSPAAPPRPQHAHTAPAPATGDCGALQPYSLHITASHTPPKRSPRPAGVVDEPAPSRGPAQHALRARGGGAHHGLGEQQRDRRARRAGQRLATHRPCALGCASYVQPGGGARSGRCDRRRHALYSRAAAADITFVACGGAATDAAREATPCQRLQARLADRYLHVE